MAVCYSASWILHSLRKNPTPFTLHRKKDKSRVKLWSDSFERSLGSGGNIATRIKANFGGVINLEILMTEPTGEGASHFLWT